MSDSLILISCSNSKTELDYRHDYFYETGPKLVDILSDDLQSSILGKRRVVFNWIKNGSLVDISRQQGCRSTHAMNRNLYLGPDLGGNDQRSTYLMAKDRYEGQFYLPVKDYWSDILSNDHHIFILSGLYGLIFPTDPIQRYSCHMTDSSSMLIAHWKDCLTNVIIYFIDNHNSSNDHKIKSIIDLLSELDYQSAFDWNEIKRLAINTYHRVFDNIAEPSEILPLLGKFLVKYFSLQGSVEFPINEYFDKFESIVGTSRMGFETDIGLLKGAKREARFIEERKKEKDILKQFKWLRFAYPKLYFPKKAIKNLSEIWEITDIIPSLPDALMRLNTLSERELESRSSIPNESITFFTQELKYYKGDIWEYRFSQDGRIFFGRSKSKTWNIDSILLKRHFSQTVQKYDDYLRNTIGKDNDDLKGK